MSRAGWLMLAASLASSPLAIVQAQPLPPEEPNTLSLSDAEKEDVLNNDTEESVDATRSGLGASSGNSRGVHGEIGGLIGSRGTRAAYGTAAIPLGENSQATVSFESSHSDQPRWTDQRR